MGGLAAAPAGERQLAERDGELEQILDRITETVLSADLPHGTTPAKPADLHEEPADRRRRRTAAASLLRMLEQEVADLREQTRRLRTRRQRILEAAMPVGIGIHPLDLLSRLIPTGLGGRLGRSLDVDQDELGLRERRQGLTHREIFS